MIRKPSLSALIAGAFVVVTASAGELAPTAIVTAERDTTIIEDTNGAVANGSGPFFFVGRIADSGNAVRRGLLRFDLPTVPSSKRLVPAVIEGVTVVLTNTTTRNVTPCEFRLHRLLADWGEGASTSTGGTGSPAMPGDATWIHRFYPDTYWMHNGAQFAGEPSARLVVAGPGVYRFEGDGLLDDVRLWAREPERNFGWILIGDETQPQTARAFASRENLDPSIRPVLEIRYRGRD
jgi:hypothetical protein